MKVRNSLLAVAGLIVGLIVVLSINHLRAGRRVIWTYQASVQDGISEFDCCADGGIVFKTNYDIQRLDSSGNLLWKSATFSSMNAFPYGHVYADPHNDRSNFVSGDGCVLALDGSGNHLWTCGTPHDDPAGQLVNFAADGTVSVAFSRSGLKYIDINGNLLQTIPLEGYHGYFPASIGPTGNIYYVYSESLVIHGQTPVYPNSQKKFRRALDKNGNELWKHQGIYMAAYDRFHPLDANTVVIGHKTDGLVAFDAQGNYLWQKDSPTDYGNNIAIDRERIYVSGHKGLRAFTHSGMKLWELEVPFWTFTPVYNGKGVVYCHEEFLPPDIVAKGDKASDAEWNSATHHLLAVNANSGELMWKYMWKADVGELKVRPDGSVVIKDDRTLVCLQP